MKLPFKNAFHKSKDRERGSEPLKADKSQLPLSVDEVLADAERVALTISSCIESDQLGRFGDTFASAMQDESQSYVFYRSHRHECLLAITVASVVAVGFVCALLIGLSVLFFSVEHFALGLAIALSAGIGVAVNIVLIAGGVLSLKRSERLERYCDILRLKRFVIIDELTVLSKVTLAVIVKDLKYAVRQMVVPQGHFECNDTLLITSDEAFESYCLYSDGVDAWLKARAEEAEYQCEVPEAVQQLLSDAAQLAEKIHDCSGLLKEKAIASDIYRIKDLIEFAAYEIRREFGSCSALCDLLSLYVPIVGHLFDMWLRSEQNSSTGETALKNSARIDKAVKAVLYEFKDALAKLYRAMEGEMLRDVTADAGDE